MSIKPILKKIKMRTYQSLAITVLGLAFLISGALAADLEDISFSSLPGDKVQITFSISGSFTEPSAFTVDEPARIALDFVNTKNKLSWRSRRVGMGNIKSIAAVEAGERTRVVINLVKQVPYTTRMTEKSLVLTLGSDTREASPTISQSGAASFQAKQTRGLKNVDFRRGDGGEGRIVVTFSEPNMIADIREEAGKIIVDFPDADLPESLQLSLDVVDFATPVKTIDTFARGNNVTMIITPTGDYEHLAFQSDKTLAIDVRPISEKEKAEQQKTQFTGEKLSLNFQDIEVRAVLQLLADFTGLNVVVSDSVRGNITLRLKNTPWDQALDIILKTKGLAMRQNGSVMLIAPSEEIAAREKLELEAQKQLTELTPLRSELIQVNYAKATVLADLIKSETNSLLSERGNISIDERTNTLLVRDTVDRLADIRKLVTSLDVPIRQVLIESRIVIANDGFSRDLGVKLGVTATEQSGNNTIFTSGNAAGFTNSPSLSGRGSNYNLNIPAAGTAKTPGTFALGLLTDTALLDLELSALQTEGKGEIVSNPKVITSNQKEALIEQGTEIPYLQASSSGATSVAFKKAVLSLNVTPQITPDDRVILDLRVTKDSVGEIFNGVPSVDTKEVQTQVLVDNGETVVLGGVFEQTKKTEKHKVPLLGDIPLIGWLFRSSSEVDEKDELLIFVTPKILKERLKID